MTYRHLTNLFTHHARMDLPMLSSGLNYQYMTGYRIAQKQHLCFTKVDAPRLNLEVVVTDTESTEVSRMLTIGVFAHILDFSPVFRYTL